MATQLTTQQKLEVVRRRTVDKKTVATIAREMHIVQRTVYKVLHSFNTGGSLERSEGSGRPLVMDEGMMRRLDNILKRHRNATGRWLTDELERRTGRRVSIRTVQLARRSLSYHPVLTRRKPLINADQAGQRFTFCQTHLHDNIHLWAFADEAGFEVDSHNQVYWIKEGEPRPVEFRPPYKAKVNVWALVHYNGRATLHFTKNYT